MLLLIVKISRLFRRSFLWVGLWYLRGSGSSQGVGVTRNLRYLSKGCTRTVKKLICTVVI